MQEFSSHNQYRALNDGEACLALQTFPPLLEARQSPFMADRRTFGTRDLRALKQTARSLLPPDSISLRMIEFQEDLLLDERARVVVPMLARLVWEELKERRPTAS